MEECERGSWLLTVGTTRFDSLFEALSDPLIPRILSAKGVKKFTIQHGHTYLSHHFQSP
jgi:hypothetical protein